MMAGVATQRLKKIQDRPPGLKFSSKIEIFKRVTRQGAIFWWERLKVEMENFQARLNLSSEIENLKRD